jgi:hypothetical protein
MEWNRKIIEQKVIDFENIFPTMYEAPQLKMI